MQQWRKWPEQSHNSLAPHKRVMALNNITFMFLIDCGIPFLRTARIRLQTVLYMKWYTFCGIFQLPAPFHTNIPQSTLLSERMRVKIPTIVLAISPIKYHLIILFSPYLISNIMNEDLNIPTAPMINIRQSMIHHAVMVGATAIPKGADILTASHLCLY